LADGYGRAVAGKRDDGESIVDAVEGLDGQVLRQLLVRAAELAELNRSSQRLR